MVNWLSRVFKQWYNKFLDFFLYIVDSEPKNTYSQIKL